MYPAIFENRDFFRFSLLSTRKRRSWHYTDTVFKKRSENGVLRVSSLIHRLIVDARETEVFEFDDVIHHILLALRILCKGCYRNSIVLAFSSPFCFVSFQVFLIDALQFTAFLILLFCMERPLAIMLSLVLLLLIPLCFANDEISNNEVSWFD